MIYAGLFYVATLLLVAGLVYKIFDYSRTPAPLKIPTTPAPITKQGVAYRMAKEVVLFESLFKSNKWIWVFGWLFHFGLMLVLLRHLRYFTEPVWFWVAIIQPFGKYASIMMVAGLGGLLARRFLVDRVRYISTPSDYLMLVLLIVSVGVHFALTGLGLVFFGPEGSTNPSFWQASFNLGPLMLSGQTLTKENLIAASLGVAGGEAP